MYSIKIEGDFSAAHNLRAYKGKCEQLHGHNWKVELVVNKNNLDKTGMVLDFKYLRLKLNAALRHLDHKYLNRLDYFKKVNPTSENIARYIYGRIKEEVSGIHSVTVWESQGCSATYYEA